MALSPARPVAARATGSLNGAVSQRCERTRLEPLVSGPIDESSLGWGDHQG